MEKKTFTFILSLAISLLAILPSSVYAQRKKIVQKAAPDTIPFYRGIAVGTDLVGSAMIALGDYGQYEGIVRVNLKDKYFPTIEVGMGKANKLEETTGIHYDTKAPYARVGIDFNVLKDKHDIYRVLVGGRIAYTTFKYNFSGGSIPDPIWKEKVPYSASDVSASQLWAEIVGGLDAKIWGPIRIGWSVRYKARLHQKQGEYGAAWYVPGYGRGGTSHLDATFHVMVEF